MNIVKSLVPRRYGYLLAAALPLAVLAPAGRLLAGPAPAGADPAARLDSAAAEAAAALDSPEEDVPGTEDRTLAELLREGGQRAGELAETELDAAAADEAEGTPPGKETPEYVSEGAGDEQGPDEELYQEDIDEAEREIDEAETPGEDDKGERIESREPGVGD